MAGPETLKLTRREQFEKHQRCRASLIAAASTICVVVVLVVLVPKAPGWEKVRKSLFNGAVLARSFPKLLDTLKINIRHHGPSQLTDGR